MFITIILTWDYCRTLINCIEYTENDLGLIYSVHGTCWLLFLKWGSWQFQKRNFMSHLFHRFTSRPHRTLKKVQLYESDLVQGGKWPWCLHCVWRQIINHVFSIFSVDQRYLFSIHHLQQLVFSVLLSHGM